MKVIKYVIELRIIYSRYDTIFDNTLETIAEFDNFF